MGFHLAKFVTAMKTLRLSHLTAHHRSLAVRKGYCAVYVGESEKKRFLIPVACLNQPFFRDLLSRAEEEFGYNYPMGGLTIPCNDEAFINLISSLK